MSESKTFVLKRGPNGDMKLACRQFRSVVGWTEIVVPGRFDCDEIEVTITPRKSVRERRAEVLRDMCTVTPNDEHLAEMLDALEAIDRRER